MTEELVFCTNQMSRGRIVRWMLEEVGVPYRTEILDFGTSMKSPEYLALNPMGTVPTLRHGTTVITEGAAICAYLADAFPKARLAPAPEDPLRGPYYRWLFFAAGPLEAATVNKAFGFEVPAERRSMAGFGTLPEVLAILEGVLATREFIVGTTFSAADVYVGSHIAWGMMTGTIDKRPVFATYAKRLGARPAAMRAREIDDALMPKTSRPTPPQSRA